MRNFIWEPIAGSGQGSTAPIKRWVDIAARVSGSEIDLYIDGIRLLSTSGKVRLGQVGLFMQGDSTIKFRNLQVESKQPTCFAIMQFSEDFNVLYRDAIKPVCEEFGYRVVRGDDFYTSGQILDDITSSIRSSALIIAGSRQITLTYSTKTVTRMAFQSQRSCSAIAAEKSFPLMCLASVRCSTTIRLAARQLSNLDLGNTLTPYAVASDA